MNVIPTLAAVAPRIRSNIGAGIPAVDMLSDALESRRKVNVAIVGEKGWGKSVALAHLSASFPDRDDLRGACFESANLRACKLGGANLEGTDFSRADLSGAIGRYLDLRQAMLHQACFHRAKLRECNFEDQTLPMVDFIEADLKDAIFSGTVIANGSFFWCESNKRSTR